MADRSDSTDRTARLALQPGTIRGIPQFVFSIPEGWEVEEAPNALAVVHAPEAVDGFWSNLLISHDRLGAAVDLKMAAQATWTKVVRQAPDARITFERTARFGENVMYLRGVEMTAPQSNRALGQLHGLCLAPKQEGAKTVDLFQLIATSLTDPANSPVAQFIEIIGSFRFI